MGPLSPASIGLGAGESKSDQFQLVTERLHLRRFSFNLLLDQYVQGKSMQSVLKYSLVLVVGFVFGYQLASSHHAELVANLPQTTATSNRLAQPDPRPDHTAHQQQTASATPTSANQSTEQPEQSEQAAPSIPSVPASPASQLPALDDLWQPNQPLQVDADWQATVAAQYPKFYQPMMTYVPPQISEALKSFLQEQPDTEWAARTEQKLRDFIQMHPQAADIQLDLVRCLQTSCELLLLERTSPAVTVMFHQLMQQPWAVSQSMSRSVVTDDKMNQVHIVLRNMPKA